MFQLVMKKYVLGAMGCLLAGTLVLSGADIKASYAKQCANCHGDDGAGKTKMGRKLKVKNYTDAKVQAMMTDEEMFKAIKDGVKEGSKTVMKPAEGLTDEEMKALVAMIRDFAK